MLQTIFILAAAGTFIALAAAVSAQTADPKDGVIYLDQGWTPAERQTYYQIPQGGEVISYDIFLNLEAAGNQELFRSNASTDRYGLTTQPSNPDTNPDGLPIGISKTVVTEGRWKGEYAALTCAACHNAQLNYQGKKIRIDGGVGNRFDLQTFGYALDDALQGDFDGRGKVRSAGGANRSNESGGQERAAPAI